jgi:outer membrane biosynthesis protein TonB
MKLVFVASLAAVITLATVSRAQTYDPLTRNCKLLKSNPAMLEPEEAIRRAINKVLPPLLDDQKIGDAQVIVTVAVDASGSPQCVAATEVSFLTRSGIEAAKGWRFDPYLVKGHAVPFVTRITFHFTRQKVWVE